tara:strand:+ start:2867 stop:3502 length:636 start_codon:yes stop_codon:yes gene_type:complete
MGKREKLERYKRHLREGKRSAVINKIIKENGYKKHLEIGVYGSCANFDKIKVDYKVGVDPGKEGLSEATFTMTSDEFFELTDDKFDIVFVDGLHHAEQVYKDILNSLEVLNEGGTIVCHDMNPQRYEHQVIPQVPGTWNGDCWKAFVQLRMERTDLKMCVIDADWGLGVIQKGRQEKLEEVELTYDNFDKNRERWLNLISEEEFFDTWVIQ